MQEILDHSSDSHGRNSLLATYIHFQACVPQPESRNYGPPLVQRPLSIPPQRKHSQRSSSHPDVHANLQPDSNVPNVDAEVSSVLRGVERKASFRGDPLAAAAAASARQSQRKLLHEEIALLWAMANSSARDAVFSNAW